jgi:phospholipase/carboxylesterase
VAETLGAERSSANLQVPLFMAHGRFDPLVLPELGEESHDFLQQQGYTVDWHAYPMPHTVSPPEIIDMARWLQRVLYKDS